MRSKVFQEILNKCDSDSCWIKIKRWYRIEIKVIKCLGILKYIKKLIS